MIYETRRLVVRQWTTDSADVDRLIDIYSRWEVAKWLGATPRPVTDRGEVAAAVRRWWSIGERDARFGLWAVVVRETGLVAGTVLLKPLPASDPTSPTGINSTSGNISRAGSESPAGNTSPAGGPVGEVEVGWHLHPECWGRGYATEAARGAVDRGFAAGLPEVYAVVRPGNDASMAVCRRLGMARRGRSRRWYGVDLEVFHLPAGTRSPAPEQPLVPGAQVRLTDPEQ